jgi:hypothetical protein
MRQAPVAGLPTSATGTSRSSAYSKRSSAMWKVRHVRARELLLAVEIAGWLRGPRLDALVGAWQSQGDGSQLARRVRPVLGAPASLARAVGPRQPSGGIRTRRFTVLPSEVVGMTLLRPGSLANWRRPQGQVEISWLAWYGLVRR